MRHIARCERGVRACPGACPRRGGGSWAQRYRLVSVMPRPSSRPRRCPRAPVARPRPLGGRHCGDDRSVHRLYEHRLRRRETGALPLRRTEGIGGRTGRIHGGRYWSGPYGGGAGAHSEREGARSADPSASVAPPAAPAPNPTGPARQRAAVRRRSCLPRRAPGSPSSLSRRLRPTRDPAPPKPRGRRTRRSPSRSPPNRRRRCPRPRLPLSSVMARRVRRTPSTRCGPRRHHRRWDRLDGSAGRGRFAQCG